ncbi:2-dehydropantoate 2-reductase [Alteromonas pelagimontana]|uniref:2-dehydropantoate 2-reductase n=1 Tax=Alteromonas pelagimontana TaxID=1858656 RepID=A0A6M4M9U6_9ALTE|nr:2-dehydropantoate 2-reductase [Alteromonas pelagimontana]QJR79924.1 2-dehydropantoate 2-reductase [Alteromonas pelagimontana]
MTELALRIVGSGAIGSLLGAGAEQAAIPYSLMPRKNTSRTLEVIKQNRETVRLKHNAPEPQTLTEKDILVLPLKAYQLADAARAWQHRLLPSTPVLLLHNGMGGYEAVRQYLPQNPLFLATTSHAALRVSSNCVQHTGSGRTDIGPAPDTTRSEDLAHQIVRVFSACFAPINWREDMLSALWIKLTVNAVINPLTAIHNIPNGELAKPEYTSCIASVITEIFRVMRSEGYDISKDALRERVYEVIHASAANYSSMHQDIAHQRATEIDAINGYVIRTAKKKGIDVSTNSFLYEKVCALQASKGVLT